MKIKAKLETLGMLEQKIEALRLLVRKRILLPLFLRTRKKALKNNSFTIISNNCWGGVIYESYGMNKMSPFIGMFIMPEDYLKLLSNLEYYLRLEPVFIDENDSKWKDCLCKKSNWGTYLIATLDGIELHMLHYHDKKVALEKWNRRLNRINWNNLIIKFNDQNGCTRKDLERFFLLPYKNKICFVCRKELVVNDMTIFIPQVMGKNNGIKASKEPYGKNRYFDVTKMLNTLKHED